MIEVLKRLYHTHRFFSHQLLYPLLLSSIVACGLFAGRVYLSHSRSYAFLIWNLFLAWIPYACGLWAAYFHRGQPGRWWMLITPAIVWAIFFPNAPYIITDFVHLKERALISFWYDLGMLATFAWTGCLLAIVSLNTMQRLVQNYLGRITGWLFAIAMLGLSGLGVYMGRILRWNSWDLFFQPWSVLLDVAEQMLNNQLRTFGFTFIFSALLFACYWTFTALQRREQA